MLAHCDGEESVERINNNAESSRERISQSDVRETNLEDVISISDSDDEVIRIYDSDDEVTCNSD